MAYTLPELPYSTTALEPHIDARTMEIHHGKHHAAYIAKVNEAIAGRCSKQRRWSCESLVVLDHHEPEWRWASDWRFGRCD